MKQTRPEAKNPSEKAVRAAIRARASFTRADLVNDTGYSDGVVGEQVRRMKARGELEVIGVDEGREVLRVKPKIPQIAASGAASIEAALWDAMRTLRRFSPTDLQFALHVARPDLTLTDARKYCQALTRAKYLRCVTKATASQEASYWLVNDTGPAAPYLKRLTVLVDPNEGAVAWTPEVPA